MANLDQYGVEHLISKIKNVISTTFNSKEITYSKLKELRDSGQLIPGQQYRITDYITTTVQEDTESAGNVFDIIVTANSNNTLNEIASACLHEGDTYFSRHDNLSAWQIWYCLDNDGSRFGWADETNGKGVIYRMIDEYGNDCPYDFKNIKFTRPIFSETDTPDSNFYYTFSYCYSYGSIIKDHSLFTTTYYSVYNNVIKSYHSSNGVQYLNRILFISDDIFNSFCGNTFGIDCRNNEFLDYCQNNTFGNSCYNNKFGSFCASNTFSDYCKGNTFGNSCWSNTFGDYFESNTFSNNCDSNKFGNNCNSNTFGANCNYNTFGDWCGKFTLEDVTCTGNEFQEGCEHNIFGDYCGQNKFNTYCCNHIFGNFCFRNTFGTKCYSFIFGNNCQYNVFGNECYGNTLGTQCSSNKFGDECDSNTFGNSSHHNSIRNYCDYNIFGNNCVSNMFSDNCISITLGSNCNHIIFGSLSNGTNGQITFKSNYKNIIFDNGNCYICLNCTGSTGTGKYYQNVRIGLGVNNSETYKTISDSNVNQGYETLYRPTSSKTSTV